MASPWRRTLRCHLSPAEKDSWLHHGKFCEAGSSTPRDCPAGTFSSAMGLRSSSSCERVQPGYWAPAGSVDPKACPAGCFCPGKARDDRHNGSEPIIVEVGNVIVASKSGEQTEIKEMTLLKMQESLQKNGHA